MYNINARARAMGSTKAAARTDHLLGMAIEGGANTQQSWPRIIAIRPEGAAFQTGGECLRQDARAEDGSFSFVDPPSAFKTQIFC